MAAEVAAAVAPGPQGRIHDYHLDGCRRMVLLPAGQGLLGASRLGPPGVRIGQWVPLSERWACQWLDTCFADCR